MGHPSSGKCVKVYDGLCLECGYILSLALLLFSPSAPPITFLSPFTSLSPSATVAIFCHEVQVSYGFKYFVAMVSLSDVAFLFVCAGSGTDLFKLGLHCGVLVCEFLDGQGFRLVVGQAEVVLRAEKGVLGFLEGCY